MRSLITFSCRLIMELTSRDSNPSCREMWMGGNHLAIFPNGAICATKRRIMNPRRCAKFLVVSIAVASTLFESLYGADPFGPNERFRSITFGKGVYVAVRENGGIFTSADLETWQFQKIKNFVLNGVSF